MSDENDSASESSSSVEGSSVEGIENPPSTVMGIFRRLGPGLIIAGSIVGSGELIATTKSGAEAGFWLLWLILIGCVIKVFVQVELGRYALVGGKTTIAALNEVPGPRFAGGRWIVWYWVLMWLAMVGQAGGMVGGVGQALSISIPLTAAGKAYNEYVDVETQLTVRRAEVRLAETRDAVDPVEETELQQLREDVETLTTRIEALGDKPPPAYDDRIWATLLAVVTAILLVVGRYGFIQWFATTFVVGFTVITMVNLVMLQTSGSWAVTGADITNGLRFRLPPAIDDGGSTALATALATFGIIGVGASELVSYPYWCLEKGYARFTGPRDDSPGWAARAHGWLRVMRWDAWCSMVIYTFATVAFYLLGAAILGRTGLNPGGTEMIRTLAVMYEPVFGSIAQLLFLFGAFAVLYSTFFVGNAGQARVVPDVLRVLKFIPENQYRRGVRFCSGLFPFLGLTVYLFIQKPALLVLVSGVMQAIMLPMLAGAALYFRHCRCDRRITPGRLWDLFLWISATGMFIAGVWAAWERLAPFLR